MIEVIMSAQHLACGVPYVSEARHTSRLIRIDHDRIAGLRVHEEALKKGVKVTGATAHFVNEICDGGPIIIQRAVEVKSGDTPEILQRRVMEQAEWNILPQAVNLFCNDKIKVIGNTTEILE